MRYFCAVGVVGAFCAAACGGSDSAPDPWHFGGASGGESGSGGAVGGQGGTGASGGASGGSGGASTTGGGSGGASGGGGAGSDGGSVGTGGASASGGSGGSAGSGASGGSSGSGGSGGGTGGTGGTGAMCNVLTPSGAFVVPTQGTGSQPSPQGGAVPSGTYVLTALTVYPPATPGTTPTRGVFVFGATSYEEATQQTASGVISRRKGSWSTGGSTLTATVTCPFNSTEYYGYTYANDALEVINASSKVVATWTKQ